MRKLLLILIIAGACLRLAAQDYKVLNNVDPLPTDMSARVDQKLDSKGRQCALFRIATQNISPEMREGFHFEPDWGADVVDRVIDGGEILLWVSPGIKTLRIIHDRLGTYELQLNNYVARVEPSMTYRIVIQGTETDPNPTVERIEQYLVFHITPVNATLEVDGETWPVSWEGTARKRVKEGTHTYLVQAPDYGMEEGEVMVKDTVAVVKVNLKALPREKKKADRRETFITLNGSYAPFSFGFSVGQVKRFGWFVSAMTNGSFTGMGNLPQVDTQGFLDDGHLPMYNGTKATDRLSVIAGGMMRVAEPLYVRVGVGYGARNLCWQDKEQNWYKIKGYSFQGVDVSAGIQAHLGGFVLSLEAVTTNFQTLEGKLGLGYSF